MVKITYISGPFHSGKTFLLLKKISDALSQHQSIDCLLPSFDHIAFYKSELLKQCVALPPGKVFFGTFVGFARRALESLQRAFMTTSEAEEWLRLLIFLKQDSAQSKSSFPGMVNLLQNLFADLRESGLSNQELSNLCSQFFQFPLKSYLNYYFHLRAFCKQTASGPASELLCQALESVENNQLPRRDLLIVDGFYEFTPLQICLLQQLLTFYEEVYFSETNHPEHPVYQVCQKFPVFFGEGTRLELDRSPESTFFIDVQKFLFSNPLPPDVKVIPNPVEWNNNWDKTALKIVRCPNRRKEVETAARTIKCWISNGLAPHKIGVVFRGSYDYKPLIDLIFSRFQIPIEHVARDLLSTEPAQLLLRILQVNLTNFNCAAVLDFLRLPAIQQYYGSRNLQMLEIYSAEWGVLFGADAWLERCQAQIDYYNWCNNQPDNESFSHFPQEVITQTEILLALLKQLFEKIRLPENLTIPNFARKAGDLFQFFAADEVVKPITSQIQALLQRCSRLISADTLLSLTEIEDLLYKLLKNEAVGKTISEPAAIFVGNLMSARGRLFEGLILLGMVDGEFPARHEDNPLLTSTQREQMNQLSQKPIFPAANANLSDEKFLFYLILGRARQYLLITFPEMDTSNKALPISPFIAELQRLFHNSEAQPALSPELYAYEFVPAAQVFPNLNQVASMDDLLIYTFAKINQAVPPELFGQIDPQIQAHLRYQLEIEQERQAMTPTEFFGSVTNDTWQLPEHLRKINVTSIQNFVHCPFYFLCEKVWQITVPEKPTLELNALINGTLIHQTLEELIRPFKNAPQKWIQFLGEDVQDSIATALDSVIAKMRHQLHFIHPLIWRRVQQKTRQGLEKFLAVEKEWAECGFYPFLLEKKYELEDALFTQIADAPDGSFILKGKIDRIDINPTQKQVFVIDYKSSAANITKIVEGAKQGKQLQIPLYLLIIERQMPEYSVGGACYYSFKDGARKCGFLVNNSRQRWDTLSPQEWEDLKEKVRQDVHTILQNIVRGTFPIKPQDNRKCTPTECPYYDICRVNVQVLRYQSSQEELIESPDE